MHRFWIYKTFEYLFRLEIPSIAIGFTYFFNTQLIELLAIRIWTVFEFWSILGKCTKSNCKYFVSNAWLSLRFQFRRNDCATTLPLWKRHKKWTSQASFRSKRHSYRSQQVSKQHSVAQHNITISIFRDRTHYRYI